jgi:ABC-type transporter Mla maintaining outer membrane lipid asymmetry ATPase subunit MlaF
VTPALELSGVVKDYRGLRPLRIDGLTIAAGEQVAIVGLDQAAAEILINLITGATLPDRGDVLVFGRSTSAIRDSDEWMTFVDRFGIVSERAVLLGALSIAQNLAIPLSLEVEPMAAELRDRATTLAAEVGIALENWEQPVASVDAAARVRVRLGRALALEPSVVLLEHPTAGVAREHVPTLGRDIKAIVGRRGAAGLHLTADREFADAAAERVLTLDPSNGQLRAARAGWLARLRNA